MENQTETPVKRRFEYSFPQTYPNPEMDAIKATAASCEVDGGAFTLTLADLRPIGPHTHFNRFGEGKSGFVEVGRFFLSPIAFLLLKDTIAVAEAYYTSHFGPLPDREKLSEQTKREMPEQKEEVEVRMGLRQQ